MWGSSNASAEYSSDQAYDLTEEQFALLHADRYVPAEQIESLNQSYPIPLITLSVSATRQATNTDQFSIVTTYKGMGVNLRERTYLIEAPAIQGVDFTAAIKKKCEESPQQMFDSMVINGALGFNLTW
ncbi:hypothetical protein A9Q99_26520 [Gammaproteobacteria bacterium 45_16_T64]|nr:hypothetical protein A9Q99_26520 [Gammaproteobacteria bacterium 45_16_T64]